MGSPTDRSASGKRPGPCTCTEDPKGSIGVYSFSLGVNDKIAKRVLDAEKWNERRNQDGRTVWQVKVMSVVGIDSSLIRSNQSCIS